MHLVLLYKTNTPMLFSTKNDIAISTTDNGPIPQMSGQFN